MEGCKKINRTFMQDTATRSELHVNYLYYKNISFQQGFIAQLVEQHIGIVEVMGSNPVGASDYSPGLSLQLLKLLHNCEDHFHFYSLSAVHIYMHIISKI